MKKTETDYELIRWTRSRFIARVGSQKSIRLRRAEEMGDLAIDHINSGQIVAAKVYAIEAAHLAFLALGRGMTTA